MIDATLVDSNVLLDVLTEDPVWTDWSALALQAAFDRGPVCINQIIYAEVSAGFDEIEQLEAVLPSEYFIREGLPWSAGFLAGKAFLRYRRAGGAKTSPLPAFYIGAHAAVTGRALLTRDKNRYSTYFPTVKLITP